MCGPNGILDVFGRSLDSVRTSLDTSRPLGRFDREFLKREQLSGQSIMFSAITDPFTRLSSWMAPQVVSVKSGPGPHFFRASVLALSDKCQSQVLTIKLSKFDN